MLERKKHIPGRSFARAKTAGVWSLLLLLSILPAARGQDTISPAPPVLQYITVEPPTGDVSLYWTASPSPDVAGYIIYRNTNESWVAVDTLRDPYATRYRDATAHAALFTEGYVIAAYDTALNLSPLTTDHTTNLLKASFDACEPAIYLSWSGYRGWGDSLLAYAVYGREDNGPFRLFDSLAPSRLGDTLRAITANVRYCFIIRAYHHNGWISRSNMRCALSSMPVPPAFISCGNMEVQDNRYIQLQFLLDTAAGLRDYVLLRSPAPGAPADTLARWQDFGESQLTFTDEAGDTLRQPLYYRLAALNTCGRVVRSSRPFTVQTLQVTTQNFINRISWPPSLSYDTLKRYRLYRQTPSAAPVLVAELLPSDTSYADNIEELQYQPGNNGTYCYYIEAVGMNEQPEKEVYSLSPITCITPEERVYFPNAFTPNGDGVNDFFAPVFSFAPAGYHLIIRDRWGKLLFESLDYTQKWDGKDLQGKPLPYGSYIFYLTARTPGGQSIRKTGQVMVIYPR